MAISFGLSPINKAMKKKTSPPSGFAPYVPPTVPPPGYYDPSLDTAVGAANRGYGDLLSDIATGNQRDTTDYLLGSQALGTQQSQGLEDIGLQASRGLADLSTQEQGTRRTFGRADQDLTTRSTRAGQDYSRAIDELTRQYAQLASRQRQGAHAAGVAGGSALLLAADKRRQNEQFDQAPVDQSFGRATEDISQSRARNQEDLGTALNSINIDRGRLEQDYGNGTDNFGRYGARLIQSIGQQQGQLDLNEAPPSADNPLGGRQFQDRETQATRAGRENLQFGLDTGAERLRQAGLNGYAPSGPSNEFRDAQGNPYQVRIEGKYAVGYNPDGSVRFRRRRS